MTQTSVLDSPNPHRLMSLASRIKAIHRALTAESLSNRSRSPDYHSPTGKKGQHSVIPRGFLRPLRFGCDRQVANATGCSVDVQSDI